MDRWKAARDCRAGNSRRYSTVSQQARAGQSADLNSQHGNRTAIESLDGKNNLIAGSA
jgi:hypothetical protein